MDLLRPLHAPGPCPPTRLGGGSMIGEAAAVNSLTLPPRPTICFAHRSLLRRESVLRFHDRYTVREAGLIPSATP